MRLLLRFASLLALILAILVGSVDAIQSVSASQPVFTPLSVALLAGGSSLRAFVETWERAQTAGLTAGAIRWGLHQPAFAFFLACSLMLWMLGYKRDAPAGRFAA